jgi:hypothetical protein
MSNEDFFATGVRAVSVASVAVAPPTQAARPEPRRRWPIALAAAIVLLGLVAAALHLRPHSPDTRPVVLPDTFAGWPTAPELQQFERDADWRARQSKDYAGNAFDGRAYGTRTPVQLFNVVVARTDGSELGDVLMGVAPFTDHGDVRCTHTMRLQGQAGPSRESPDMVLCFRAEARLTVSVLAIGHSANDAQIAAGVDDVWALQG